MAQPMKKYSEMKVSSVSFRIHPDDHKLLRNLSIKLGISQTEVFERAIYMMAKKHGVWNED